MRIEAVGSRAFNLQSDAARSAAQAVFIMGEHDMNIEREDRLTYQGDLIKVVFIQSNRIGATIAEGIIEQ